MTILTRLAQLEKKIGKLKHKGLTRVYYFYPKENNRRKFLYSFPNGKEKDDKMLIMGGGFEPPHGISK